MDVALLAKNCGGDEDLVTQPQHAAVRNQALRHEPLGNQTPRKHKLSLAAPA